MKARYIDEISNWTIGRAVSRPLSCSSGASLKTARRGYYASAKAVSSAVDYET
jgi:hypothetical protein